MPWGRIDADFWRHRKVDALEDNLAAVGLFWLAVSWSNDKGTDGLVGQAAIRKLGGSVELAEVLVGAGLWDREGDAYRVHDFLKFNKSAAQVAEEKAHYTALGAAGLAARYGDTPSDTLDAAPLPVSRIPYPVTPIPVSPSRAGEDAADAYWSLTGRYPAGKALAWIDDLIAKYGSEQTTKAVAEAFYADRTVQTLLGRAQDALRAAARRLDHKEADEERERLRQKRAAPRQLDPMEQAFRDALEERYRKQGAA